MLYNDKEILYSSFCRTTTNISSVSRVCL